MDDQVEHQAFNDTVVLEALRIAVTLSKPAAALSDLQLRAAITALGPVHPCDLKASFARLRADGRLSRVVPAS